MIVVCEKRRIADRPISFPGVLTMFTLSNQSTWIDGSEAARLLEIGLVQIWGFSGSKYGPSPSLDVQGSQGRG